MTPKKRETDIKAIDEAIEKNPLVTHLKIYIGGGKYVTFPIKRNNTCA